MRSTARPGWRLSAAIFLTSVLAAPAALRAAADEVEVLPPAATASEKSAASGAFLPWTMGARSDAQRAFVHMQGGYDGAEKGAVFQTVLEAQVFGRLSVRAGGSYLGPSGQFRPEAGLRVDALRQERHGVDLAILGGYETRGFNNVKAMTARVAVSRAFGDTRVVGNVGYGYGFGDGERYGDLRLAGLRALTSRLQVGLDSRLRIDLERDNNEPAGEPEWDVVTGPIATYAFDRLLVSASAGMSATKLRLTQENRVGAIGTLGVGTVF